MDTEFQTVAGREGEPERKHAPDWVKVPVEEVARVALRAVSRDQARIVPGFWMMMAPFFFALVPLFVLRLFYASLKDAQTRAAARGPHRLNHPPILPMPIISPLFSQRDEASSSCSPSSWPSAASWATSRRRACRRSWPGWRPRLLLVVGRAVADPRRRHGRSARCSNLLVSLALLGRFLPSLFRGKLNPAAYVVPLSIVGVVFALMLLFSAGHP